MHTLHDIAALLEYGNSLSIFLPFVYCPSLLTNKVYTKVLPCDLHRSGKFAICPDTITYIIIIIFTLQL